MSFQNTSILVRLSVGFASLIALTLLLGLFAFSTMDKLANQTTNLHDHPMAVINAALDARGSIISIRNEVLKAALLGKPEAVDASLKRSAELEKEVYADIDLMLNRFLGDKAKILQAQQDMRDWKPIRDQVFAFLREGKRDEGLALVFGKGGQMAEAARLSILEVITFASAKGDSFYANAIATRDQALRVTTALLGVIVGLGILVAFLITRSLSGPVGKLRAAMERLAVGDNHVTIPYVGLSNEIGAIAKTVQVFKDNGLEKSRMEEAEHRRLAAEQAATETTRAREQAIGQEIAHLIDTVSKGDLSSRLDLTGKEGFYRTMSVGINRLTDTVEGAVGDIARVLSALAEGDLTQRITKSYQGAFDKLKSDVNATSVRLSEIVGRIGEASEEIVVAASQVSSGSSDLSERTEEQASSLEETAGAMEQLGTIVHASAENAQRANVMARDARTAAEQGGDIAGAAITAMHQIAQASRRITDIIGVIDEIAFQTNLLALNAAVEAARAGDAGKGFAVVAQEVRILAQRSAQASKEIKTLILNSDNQVQNGVDLVKKAGQSLGGIAKNVQQVAAIINEIAEASAEQSNALKEINTSVAAMDEMTQKNAALVEETSAAAQTMAGQASDLREQVAFFKIAAASVHR